MPRSLDFLQTHHDYGLNYVSAPKDAEVVTPNTCKYDLIQK